MFPENEKALYNRVESLVGKVAFMSVSLDELQSMINHKGYIEPYQNGENQSGYKKSSEIDIYNSMVKNYSTVYKLLLDSIPDGSTAKDGLMDFVKGKK